MERDRELVPHNHGWLPSAAPVLLHSSCFAQSAPSHREPLLPWVPNQAEGIKTMLSTCFCFLPYCYSLQCLSVLLPIQTSETNLGTTEASYEEKMLSFILYQSELTLDVASADQIKQVKHVFSDISLPRPKWATGSISQR